MIHMEENKGGRRVGVVEDDMSDGMQCINHPHRKNNYNNSGGICAFCLQEKLGMLVSSSSSLPIHPSSSSSSPSSSSDSFRSNSVYSSTNPSASASIITTRTTSTLAPTSFSSVKKNGTNANHIHHQHYMRSRLAFLLAKKNKNNKAFTMANSSSSSASASAAAATSDIIFKRSKSTAIARTRGKFLDDDDGDIVIEDFNFSPKKRNWLWSFLYLSSKPSSSKKFDAKSLREKSYGGPRISSVNAASCTSREKCSYGTSSMGRKSNMVVEEEVEDGDSVASASFDRKVSRSRSVGCGSRSFSGDFFDKISTGLGDCTLRRVESQREGINKVSGVVNRHHHFMKERVMCGGLFSGFMMTSSSSNSSASSTYWVSSSAADAMNNSNNNSSNGESAHGRGSGKSWGWAFASPMRAFGTKTSSSKDNKKDASDKNVTPNLSAIPSLLTVSS
ncbi:unnamed protein product [Lupinus luteus]|uniref:Vitellogenin-like protein n=1 Tax=Lupinus luteus TaxID=3873 RepID=A0AAV1YME1_LUPLU